MKSTCISCEHRAKAFKEKPCDVCYTKSVKDGISYSEYQLHHMLDSDAASSRPD